MPERPGQATTVDAYDAAAAEWERGLGFRSPQFSARLRDVILRLLRPAAGGRLALELGPGTGWMLPSTAPLFGELRAIEPSRGMLQLCQRRIAELALDTVRAEPGDATSLEGIADGSVDAIYAVGLLDAVGSPEKVFAACHRVLRPGGILVVSTSNGQSPWYTVRDALFGKTDVRTGRYLTRDDLIRYAHGAGLREIEIVSWGAAPPWLSRPAAVVMMDALERWVRGAGLSRYLGVLTASFQRPADSL